MTNDAPERIWTTGNHETGSWNDHCVRYAPQVEYIRADHAQAETEAAVAAAYEDAAHTAFDWIMKEADRVDTPEAKDALEDAADHVLGNRALTDTDALAARDARVRAEALREAAEEANEVAQARLSDERDTALACRDRILALIPTDQEENSND